MSWLILVPDDRAAMTRHPAERQDQPALRLVVHSIREIAERVKTFELVSPDGSELPRFSAGAHIDVVLGEGLIRQYSLCNNPRERDHYQIAVLLEEQGRGGSRAMHAVNLGASLPVSYPRNNFALDLGADEYVLIAGGIGITPFIPMIYELERAGKAYALHYCARSPERMPFRELIPAIIRNGRFHFYFRDGVAARGLKPDRLLEHNGEEHLYFCGPQSLMDAVKAASKLWPSGSVHSEYFDNKMLVAAKSDGAEAFEVILAASKLSVRVPPDVSIVSALEAHGIVIPTSCEQGVCGTCCVEYMEGEPIHRDLVLTPDEQLKFIATCCSRSATRRLVLKL
jgi:ferredoxin-NADP reductase